MNVFQFSITCKRTNNTNNVTHPVKLGKKRRECSKRNYCIISPKVIIKAIIIMNNRFGGRAEASSHRQHTCRLALCGVISEVGLMRHKPLHST